MARPTPVILDVDNALTHPVQDTDDAMAIALALVSPEIEVLGITACAGNCRARESLANTLRILHVARAGGLPTGLGPESPLRRDVSAHFAFMEARSRGAGARYWEGLEPPAPMDLPTKPEPAREVILRAARSRPGEVVVVALGSLTNLAMCCLKDPEAAAQLAGVLHMGGILGRNGFSWSTPDIPDTIWRTTLRFNTCFDPDASAVVFQSGIAVTLVPADVTTTVFQHPADVDRLEAAGTPLHRHLAQWGRPWIEWSIGERGLPGAHLHDPLTLAVLLWPSLFSFETLSVDIPAMLADRPWIGPGEEGCRIRAATAVDGPRAEALLSDRLCRPVLHRYREETRLT